MFKIFGPNKRNCSSSVIYRQKVFNSKIHVKSYNCDYRHTWKVVPGIRDVYRWNPRTRDQGPKMYRWDTWLGTPKVRPGTRDSKINSELCWWMRFEDFLIQIKNIPADIYLFKVSNRKLQQVLWHMLNYSRRQQLKTCWKYVY